MHARQRIGSFTTYESTSQLANESTNQPTMKGFHFSRYRPETNKKPPFERLLDLFMQLLHYTSGDAAEALNWLTQLDREHKLTDNDYGIGDFIEDLKKNGYLEEQSPGGGFKITAKSEQTIRKRSLDE